MLLVHWVQVQLGVQCTVPYQILEPLNLLKQWQFGPLDLSFCLTAGRVDYKACSWLPHTLCVCGWKVCTASESAGGEALVDNQSACNCVKGEAEAGNGR